MDALTMDLDAPPQPLTREGLRRMCAREIIPDHTLLTAASAAIPLALAGAAASVAVQVRMAERLCALYGAPAFPTRPG